VDVKNRLAALHAAVFVVVSLTTPAAAQSGASPTKEAVDLSRIRIDNFGRVNPNYYRGSQPGGRDYTDLAALGVKTVINLTSDDADAREKVMVEQTGLLYVPIPMTTHTPPTVAQLAEFLKVVNDPAQQPVYVHCVGGRHRTGVMTALYRMIGEHWTADRAFAEMKTYKYGADFLHPEFKQFVYAYQGSAPAPAIAATASEAHPRTARSADTSQGHGEN
jgi:protein tyrosine/serine phosphatase